IPYLYNHVQSSRRRRRSRDLHTSTPGGSPPAPVRAPPPLPLPAAPAEVHKVPRGVTEHARILYASDVALSSTTVSPAGLEEAGATSEDGHHRHHPFTAAYLDISRGPETQMWMYSTLERCGGDEMNDEEERRRKKALRHAVSLLRAARRIRDECVATPAQSSPLGPCILAGTLSEALRTALRDEAGIAFSHASLYNKWLLDARELPPLAGGSDKATTLLEPGMRWGSVQRGIYRWPHASLSSLHCEEPYHGRGFAKAVAAKLIRDHLKDYGGDDSMLCYAEVAADNPSSQGVCKSLGGQDWLDRLL
ncbi:gnat family protein, partial [Apiospora phragmitis]